jgi:hypothetical protein
MASQVSAKHSQAGNVAPRALIWQGSQQCQRRHPAIAVGRSVGRRCPRLPERADAGDSQVRCRELRVILRLPRIHAIRIFPVMPGKRTPDVKKPARASARLALPRAAGGEQVQPFSCVAHSPSTCFVAREQQEQQFKQSRRAGYPPGSAPPINSPQTGCRDQCTTVAATASRKHENRRQKPLFFRVQQHASDPARRRAYR